MIQGERYKEWEKLFPMVSIEVSPDSEDTVEAFTLPSSEWSDNYHQLVCQANWKAYTEMWPRWVRDNKYKDSRGSVSHEAVVPANLLYMIPHDEYTKLFDAAVKVKDDYPLVNDEYHSDLEQEYRDKAWVEEDGGRQEFKDFLIEHITEDYEGKTDRFGEPLADKMIALLTDAKLDSIFYELEYNGGGDHWDDHNGTGDFSLDIKRLLSSNYIPNVPSEKRYQISLQNIYEELLEELYPEDPRQMKFQFADEVVERLLTYGVEALLDPTPAAKLLVATLMEGHSYSCVMINLPDELRDYIVAWGKQQIPDTSLFVDKDGGKGREEEIHVTVKYGLLDAMPSPDLKEVFRGCQPFEVSLLPITLFRQDDYDVVKLDVSSAQLHGLNQEVCNAAAHHDSYPEYHPHVTIAYVKKGTCDRLENVSPWDDPVKLGVSALGKEGKFTAKTVIFSSSTDVKKEYDLGGGRHLGEGKMTPADLAGTVGLTPLETPMRQIRRRVGRNPVTAVWIDKKERSTDQLSQSGFGTEGELRLYFQNGRGTKSEFCCWEVLKMSVRQWRNLYGARLFVNGEESGVVSYQNPALQDESFIPRAYRGGV